MPLLTSFLHPRRDFWKLSGTEGTGRASPLKCLKRQRFHRAFHYSPWKFGQIFLISMDVPVTCLRKLEKQFGKRPGGSNLIQGFLLMDAGWPWLFPLHQHRDNPSLWIFFALIPAPVKKGLFFVPA